MTKGKEQISLLANLMLEKGIIHVVVSPGSRNAPAIILFAQYPGLKLISVADERSAGFFALGIAIKTRKPVALLCTSGSAVLNYAPAIAEAYYQKVPLLVLTADRPQEWIDQADGQTIRQENVFANYIRKSFHLPSKIESPESIWYANRVINESIDRCLYPAAGPVHLNIPLAEPLYKIDLQVNTTRTKTISVASVEKKLPENTIDQLAQKWNITPSKLILIGQLPLNNHLMDSLIKLVDDPSVCVLTETNSNLPNKLFIGCIDRVIDGMTVSEIQEFNPEILLTMGGAVVSKKVKSLLRQMKPAEHWHVCDDPEDFYTDTYQSLSLTIPLTPEELTIQLTSKTTPIESTFRQKWTDRNFARKVLHEKYILSLEFCDMQVYDLLFRVIPAGTEVHLANSTPVRYAQLFDQGEKYRFFANRGTSGIDGCVSTAAGSAYVSENPVTVITGDIGLFYDSNALWNNNLKPDFRIILINNGGGNIFRILDGPSDYPQLESFIETTHQYTAEGLASNFGLNYLKASDKPSLEKMLDNFYDYNIQKPAILEIITPNILSAKALKEYFKFLNS